MLDEYLENLNYSEEQINIIHNFYPTSTYSSSALLYNLKNLYNFLHRNGVSNKEFINITITTPNILLESIEDIKLKIYELSTMGFNKLDAFNIFKTYPYILKLNIEKIRNRLNKFIDLGFSKEEVIYIITTNAYLLEGDFSSYKRRFDYFIEYGYSKRSTINIFTNDGSLFDCNITLIKNKMNDFKELGFNDTDIIRITSLLPNLFMVSTNIIQDKFKYLLDFGYTDIDISFIIKKIPIILKDYYLQVLIDKLDNLLKLGFSKEEVILMTCNNPYILLYSCENINNKFKEFIDFKISKDNTIKMFVSFPLLFGYDWNSILDKINFYNKIKLNHCYIDNSKIFIYPIELIQARFIYLSKKMNINEDNYDNLFLSDYAFYKKFKIKRNKLLKGEF